VAQHGGALRPIAVTLHHQVGNGNPVNIYASRNVSAHFWIPKSGTPVQHVDTGTVAWHGGTAAMNTNGIGVETEGCGTPPHAEPLTDHQINLFAELMAWADATHGIPLVLSESATTPGLNYHRAPGGYNTACPCDVRKNARAEILRRAGAGGASAPQDESEGNMIASTPEGRGYWTTTRDGAVYALGNAQFHGNAMEHLPAGRRIVGIAADRHTGYWLLSDGGDIYSFGSAQFYGKPDRV
jgi:hypothetical protein